MIGKFTVSRPTQVLPTNENSKSWTSPTVWDGRRQIGKIGSVSTFPTRPRFLRCSVIIQDIKTSIFTVGDVGDSFGSLPITILLSLFQIFSDLKPLGSLFGRLLLF